MPMMTENGLPASVHGKMNALQERFEQVEAQINEAAMGGNHARVVALSREHARLRGIVEPYRQRRKFAGELEDHQALIADPTTDAELRAMAEAELPEIHSRIQKSDQELIDY